MLRLLQRLRTVFRLRDLDEDLAEELEFHRAMKAEELERDGHSVHDAQREARRALGNLTRSREDARAVWIWPWLDSVGQDVRYAVRSLRRQPGFTLVAIAALGVSIGLNSSLFTVFAGLALRPMAGIGDPERVVSVSAASDAGRGGTIGFSFPEYHFLAEGAQTLAGLVAYRALSVTLESDRVGRSTPAYGVTGDYFDVLGVRMAQGRGFLAHEDRRESPARVAVLSYPLWQGRFGGAPIVGREIQIEGVSHTVVGITAPGFTGPEGSVNRVWLPLSSLPTLRQNDPFMAALLDRWQDCCVNVTGRLADGTSREEAGAELQVLSQRFRAGTGQDARDVMIGGTQFLEGRDAKWQALAIIGVLFIGITLLLFIACANVGNLLLARAAARMSEIGVRLSIGASRLRIVRQLLTEGLVLACIATTAGVALAGWLPPLVLELLAGESAPFDIEPDSLVIGYALGLAVVACVASALAPALHATRIDITSALKDAPRLRPQFRLRTMLLATQVAVTVVLLISAGLLLRGVSQARTLDLGFTMDGVGVATIDLPPFAYDRTRAAGLVNELSAALRDSGLQSFAFAAHEPLGDMRSVTGVRLSGEREDQTRTIEFIDITPGYFGVLGLPVIAGRDFEAADQGRPVIVVNETLARQYWPGRNPVGQTFVRGGSESVEIVGLVRDARLNRLDAVTPVFFSPFDARTQIDGFPKLMFRASQSGAWTAVGARIASVEPRARVDVAPLRDRFARELAQLNFAPMAASILGLFGLTLATIGMFGVFAYAVRQRTKEIGIRMSLGARPGTIARELLSGHSRAVIAGLVVGLAGAFGASQVLRSSLYGLSPLDPTAYGGVVLLLTVAAAAASYVPARRATRIDPVVALRHD